MRWHAFLQRTLTATATAAAGGAATAVTANPVLGAAAAAAASKSTEELLAEFLPAQKEALDTLVERTRGIESLLGAVHSNIEAMIDRDWQAALLSIADAAKHPERAQGELHVARRRLFDAWGGANTNAKRAQISQELSVVYGLLGEPDDSREWLFRSYSEASEALVDSISETWDSIDHMPRVKARRKAGGSGAELVSVYLSEKEDLARAGSLDVALSAGLLRDPRRYEVGAFSGWLRAEPLITGLKALAEARVALVELQFSCAVAQMPRPWTTPNGADISVFRHPRLGTQNGISMYAGSQRLTILSNAPTPMRPVELLHKIADWTFVLSAPPGKSPNVFVSGSSAELGAWNVELAVPLERVDKTDLWECRIAAYDADRTKPVEYRYFCVPKKGGRLIWESGKKRRLKAPEPPFSQAYSAWRFRSDRWRGTQKKGKKDPTG